MKTLQDTCKLAVIKASPVLFNKEESLQKALRLLHEAAENGA